ncbi:MAG: ABC transporter permease [Spirochaetes bacterium]|nr:ABC transporter permease [Spirochaetota bacterium]
MTVASCLAIGMRLLVGRGTDRRDLARRSLRGAVIGIAVSLVPIVVVLVVADGMIQGITARYIELGTYHKQVIPRYSATFGEADDLASRIRGVSGVEGAWAEIQSFGVTFAGGVSSGVAIRAVDPAFLLASATGRYLETVEGSVEAFDSYGAIAGKELAKKLGLRVGDTINLITLRSNSGSDPKPRVSVYVLRAVVSSGYRELDANWLFIHPKAASRILVPATSRILIGVKIADPYAKEYQREAASGIPSKLTLSIRDVVGGNVSVFDWRDLERGLMDSLESTRSILLFIMALIVGVAAVNVGGALVTLVMERSNEIAVLKSFGMSSGDIALVFLVIGTIVGTLGAAAGTAIGAFAAVNVNEAISLLERSLSLVDRAVRFALDLPEGSSPSELLNPDYYLEMIPIVLDYASLAFIAAGTVVISLLTSILPARKAAGLQPLEILRRR